MDKVRETSEIPIGDVGDVARLVAYVVDEKNKFIIGADIIIDGGITA